MNKNTKILNIRNRNIDRLKGAIAKLNPDEHMFLSGPDGFVSGRKGTFYHPSSGLFVTASGLVKNLDKMSFEKGVQILTSRL